MLWTLLIPVLLFGITAYYDWKLRQIPDWAIALCWAGLLLPIYGFLAIEQFVALSAGFTVFYAMYAIRALDFMRPFSAELAKPKSRSTF